MNIQVSVDPAATTPHETALIEMQVENVEQRFRLDIDGTTLIRNSPNVSDLAKDFLFIGAVVYACDKAVDRNNASFSEDRWEREFSVELPVLFPDRWNAVAGTLEDCIAFLTGDEWNLSFVASHRNLLQRRRRKRHSRLRFMRPFEPSAVSLFSGGLDSFIGALDWLSDHEGKLFLVGHYDRDLKGPKHDQTGLAEILEDEFGDRYRSVSARVGVTPAGDDINLRSRSFLFVALATFFAEQFGPRVPIIIPENGPIALNLPLTSSRRGSCSTRTVHPHFLSLLKKVMAGVGFHHPLTNPYAFKTKGEMASECRSKELLARGYALSRSCAKAGHKSSWHNRNARGCGRCVPCLFRRAALHQIESDDEAYGIDVLREDLPTAKLGADTLSLFTFLRRNHTEREIQRALLAHGPLPLDEIAHYAEMILRMREEVRNWISDKGSEAVKEIVGLQHA